MHVESLLIMLIIKAVGKCQRQHSFTANLEHVHPIDLVFSLLILNRDFHAEICSFQISKNLLKVSKG